MYVDSDPKDISYSVYLCICIKKNYVAYMKLNIWNIFWVRTRVMMQKFPNKYALFIYDQQVIASV